MSQHIEPGFIEPEALPFKKVDHLVSLVMTDRNWLPYESLADKLLLDTALDARRRFTKSLRYNLAPDKPMASLVFTDTETPTAAFLLHIDEDRDAAAQIATDTGTNVWTWVLGDDMPALPAPAPAPRADRAPRGGGL